MDEIHVLLQKFNLFEDDLQRVRELGLVIIPEIEDHLDEFYSWMKQHHAYREFFEDDPHRLKRVRNMQAKYWKVFFEAKIDSDWLAQRRYVGQAHANINLPNDIYFAATSLSAQSLTKRIDGHGREYHDSLHKLLYLDSFVVIEEISRIYREKIDSNAQAIMELSTPVTPIYNGILHLPILGFVDSLRAQEIMKRTLGAINRYGAKVLLLDISGVTVMDTQVSDQIIKIAKAAKFMGCNTIISGLSAEIAQTLVELGIDTGGYSTRANLEDAFQAALQELHLEISNVER